MDDIKMLSKKINLETAVQDLRSAEITGGMVKTIPGRDQIGLGKLVPGEIKKLLSSRDTLDSMLRSNLEVASSLFLQRAGMTIELNKLLKEL